MDKHQLLKQADGSEALAINDYPRTCYRRPAFASQSELGRLSFIDFPCTTKCAAFHKEVETDGLVVVTLTCCGNEIAIDESKNDVAAPGSTLKLS